MKRHSENRTHCLKGHDLAVVGTYKSQSRTTAGTIYVSKCCKKCKSESAKRRNDAIRDRHKGKKGIGRPLPEIALKTGKVDLILQLIDEKERALTVWERNAIQDKIDRLRPTA